MTDPKKPIVLERTYDASLEDVWSLWTTKEGFESWWGPEGFSVEVNELDLRPGGALVYTMTATGAEQAEFMKRAGMPLSTKTRITYVEVVPREKLAYLNTADFIPGVAPYDTGTTVSFTKASNGVRMTITIDPMHDEVWTGRMAAGWEGQLGKLDRLFAARAQRK